MPLSSGTGARRSRRLSRSSIIRSTGPGRCTKRWLRIFGKWRGELIIGTGVDEFEVKDNRIIAVKTTDVNGEKNRLEGSHVLVSLPLTDFVKSTDADVPPDVLKSGEQSCVQVSDYDKPDDGSAREISGYVDNMFIRRT